jgi:preprotein translocase subunit SecD
MEILNNRKFQTIAVLFLLGLLGVFIYAKYSGLLLILSLMIFGSLAAMWKEKEVRLACLAALVLLAISSIGLNGLKFGIDFNGGTRIPVILEQAVDQNTMNELVQTIKKRASILGLTEVKVRAVGSTEIDVEIPSSDESQISFIEEILSHQGVYQGVVDGKVAISGDEIYSSSIRPLTVSELQAGASDWGVGFSITREGGDQFAKVVKGKGNYPLYMFLDRPNDAAVFISSADLMKKAPDTATQEDVSKALRDSLRLENGKDIPVYITDVDDYKNVTAATNKTRALVSKNAPQELKDSLAAKGFTVTEFEDTDFQPQTDKSTLGGFSVREWSAVGLLSAPELSPKITIGVPAYSYVVSGQVRSTGTAKQTEALENEKRIESVLKGGSLPVQISLGSRTTLPASLGSEFLKLSLIGIVTSLIVISLLISLRYMNAKIILPIIVISISELIILLAILGSFTIDLAAMAGILAAIGVGVDAQVVITDEILKKDNLKLDEKMEHALDIIKTSVVVAIFAMLPLLFSGLVEVIGFSISTILGSLLGFLISRPAYAVIVETLVEHTQDKPQEKK